MTAPRCISKREAARLLGVSRGTTLEGMIARGELRAVEYGGRVRIPVAEIDRITKPAIIITPGIREAQTRVYFKASDLSQSIRAIPL